jgi:hypothetical protein
MVYRVEVRMADGTTRMEDVSFKEETSHYRLQQKVLQEIPGAESCKIFEDKWKKGSKSCKPTEHSRPVVYMKCTNVDEKTYEPVLLLFGWSDDDIKPIVGGSLFWTYLELPSLPAELEGNG